MVLVTTFSTLFDPTVLPQLVYTVPESIDVPAQILVSVGVSPTTTTVANMSIRQDESAFVPRVTGVTAGARAGQQQVSVLKHKLAMLSQLRVLQLHFESFHGVEDGEDGVAHVRLDIDDLLLTLLGRELRCVYDTHLLDHCRLARLARAQQQKLDGGLEKFPALFELFLDLFTTLAALLVVLGTIEQDHVLHHVRFLVLLRATSDTHVDLMKRARTVCLVETKTVDHLRSRSRR